MTGDRLYLALLLAAVFGAAVGGVLGWAGGLQLGESRPIIWERS